MTNVIMYTDGKTFFGLLPGQLVEDGFHHCWGKLLGRQSITPTDYLRKLSKFAVAIGFRDNIEHVVKQRFSGTAGRFASIQHRQFANAVWKCVKKCVACKRQIQAYMNHTDFLTLTKQSMYRVFYCFSGRAHDDNHLLCIFRPDIFKQVVMTSG